MQLPSDADLRAALQAHTTQEHGALPGRTNHRRAGVLVPLCDAPEPHLILMLRAAHIRHGGEVSFPGGRPEPEDADLQATALREAQEELGITEVQVLGRLSSTPLFTSEFRLEPVVGRVAGGPLSPDPGEVARPLRLPLARIFDGSAVDGLGFEWEGRQRISPLFLIEDQVCFGATAIVLAECMRVLAPLMGQSLPRVSAGDWVWDMAAGRPVRPAHRV